MFHDFVIRRRRKIALKTIERAKSLGKDYIEIDIPFEQRTRMEKIKSFFFIPVRKEILSFEEYLNRAETTHDRI